VRGSGNLSRQSRPKHQLLLLEFDRFHVECHEESDRFESWAAALVEHVK
jgi:hypothetical protein